MNHHTQTTHHVRRFVLALLFALLPALAPTADAAPQFSTLTIGNKPYDAAINQSGPRWTWTASTNTLEFFYDYEDYNAYYNYLNYLINGNIAFGTSNPAAVATIEVNDTNLFINGSISCQGALLVNVNGESNFKVNGSLAGSLSVADSGYDHFIDARMVVSISNDITGNLSVRQGTVKVGGKVSGNLTVSGGVVTINGTVSGTRDITDGAVKVNGSLITSAPPSITASATIQLNNLIPGVPTIGNGWSFDGEGLDIVGSRANYTLTGTAPSGSRVDVAATVDGSLTLDGVTINAASNYCALLIEGSNRTIHIKNNNTLTGGRCGIMNVGDGALTLDSAAGSTLTAISAMTGAGIEQFSDLVLQGSGAFNFYGVNSVDASYMNEAILVWGDLLLKDSVTVNATASDHTGANPDESGQNHGIVCFGDITIAGNAKLNAAGGSAFGAGCRAGSGILILSKLTVTSSAANALIATGGVGVVVDPWHGSGIAALFDLQIAGTGSIKAVGDNALASVYDISIAGCKITAEAGGSAGYALHAGGHNGANFAGGTVRITGGTTTASNITKPANIYYKTLIHTGGILNGANKGDEGTDDDDKKDDKKGGGGGGAPSWPGLALIAAMLAWRASKKKNRESGLSHPASAPAATFLRLSSPRRLVFALLLTLLPALSPSASAAAQFLTLTIGGGAYNATQNQSGPGWKWTASTNTLEFSWAYRDLNYSDTLINGNIAFGTNIPTAVATIEVNDYVFINGNISCEGALLVNASRNFVVLGSLAASLFVTLPEYGGDGPRVSVSNDITGNLSVNGGTVKVGGKVNGNLTVSGGVVTINGTVGGTRNATGGIVKVNGSFIKGAPPTITASTTIPLNTLALGSSTSGNGWWFESRSNDWHDSWFGTLHIEDPLINYTLTGTASRGIGVLVADTVNGSLTLDGVMIDSTSPYGDNADRALAICASNLTVYVKNNNTLIGNYFSIDGGGAGSLTLDAAAGATLNILGFQEVYNDLVLQGSGTFNFYGSEWEGSPGIYADGDLLLQGSVTVNATGNNYTRVDLDESGWNHGISCEGDITIAGNAKLNATGGSAFGAGCKAGSGILTLSKLTVTSSAANALVATGGVGAVVGPLHGSGIAALFDLQIAGAGSIKAIGDNALASVYDISIAGCKITAEASGSTGYALHAGGRNGATFAGGTVRITGGTTAASNITEPANIYYKTLVHTGGILNGVNKGDEGTGDDDKKDDKKGGGGGGAPSWSGLALIAAMLAWRASKKKNR